MKGWCAVATFLVTSGTCVSAWAVDVGIDCPRLDAKQKDELRARARLALRGATQPPRSLLVACDEEHGWVVWDGPPLELLKMTNDENLVEGALDTLESRAKVTAPPAPAETPAPPKPAAPPPARELPTFAVRHPREPRETNEANDNGTGGVAFGIAIENGSHTLSPSAGPRLDLAVGWRPVYILLIENARFGSADTGDGTFAFDLSGGVGVGAPFVPGYVLGAVLTSGVEYFNVVSTTRASAVVTLGLRSALPVGPITLAPGIDVRYRFAPQFIGDKVDVQLPHWAGFLVLEAALQVEPISKKKPARR